MKSRVCPAHGVLSKGTARCHHLVERGDAVARREFVYVGAYAVDVACDVVARIVVGSDVVGGDFPGEN